MLGIREPSALNELNELIALVAENPQISVFWGHESDELDELVELSKQFRILIPVIRRVISGVLLIPACLRGARI